MKFKTRTQKLTALQNAMNGDSSLLREYKNSILEPITHMVVYDFVHPGPDDLVDVTVRHTGEKQTVTYGEFLKRPDYYHTMCIAVDA